MKTYIETPPLLLTPSRYFLRKWNWVHEGERYSCDAEIANAFDIGKCDEIIICMSAIKVCETVRASVRSDVYRSMGELLTSAGWEVGGTIWWWIEIVGEGKR